MALNFEDFFNSVFGTNGVTFKKQATFTLGTTSPSTATVLSGAAATSGGNTTPAVVVASTTTGSGVGIYFGAGAPSITAPQGSLYLNTTGSSSSTRAYVNTTGSTTWTAITTAA